MGMNNMGGKKINNYTSKFTTENGDTQSMGERINATITSADNNRVEVTTEHGDTQNIGEGSKAKVTSADNTGVEVSTEHCGVQSRTEQRGWEKDNNYTSKVTTEHGDPQSMGERSNATITSADNIKVEVTTEHRGEQSETEQYGWEEAISYNNKVTT